MGIGWPLRMGRDLLRAPGPREALELLNEGRILFLWTVLVTLAIWQALGHALVAPALLESQLIASFGYLVVGFGFTLLAFGPMPRWNQPALGALHLVFDTVTICAWVFLVGGRETVFALIFIAEILIAGLIYRRRGSYVASFLSCFVFPWILHLEAHNHPHPWLGWLASSAIFMTVGLVGGLLSEELQRTLDSLKAKQGEIQKLTELHEQILKGVPTGLVTVDSDLTIHFVNPAAAHILESGELVGKSLTEIAPGLLPFLSRIEAHDIEEPEANAPSRDPANGDTSTVVSESLGPRRKSFFAHPKNQGSMTRLQQEVELDLGTKRKMLRGDVAPLAPELSVGGLIGSPKPGSKVLVFQDVTKLVQLEERLRQHAKLAAVGQLAAGIAHEIRNPLASMSASIEMLKGTLPPSVLAIGENARLMEIALKEIDRLNDLITEFLDFVKPDSIKLEPVDVGPVLAEVVLQISRVKDFQLGTQVVTSFEPKCMAYASSAKLRQVVWNLMLNAVQAMEKPGKLEVGCARVAPSHIRLWVQDDGKGMTGAVQQHLYEPFFTTKERGTGLGLATAYKIVEAHRGEIRVSSSSGLGTRFEVYLESV